MRTKERPHLTRGIDTVAVRADEPPRKRLATEPLMASSVDGVQHHVRVVSTIRVFAAGDISRHRRFDGVGSAAVSSSPIRRPCRDCGKRSGSNPRLTAVVQGERIGSPVKRNHRNCSMFCTPAPRQCLRSSHHADRRDPISQHAGQHKSHASAIGKAVGIDPHWIDVVGRLQFVDQLRDESDIPHETGPSAHVPDPGADGLDSRWVDDNEPLVLGQLVPLAQVHLLGRPSRCAVHADDEWRRLRAVVAPRDVEQVLPLLARGDDGAVVPIANVERECLAQGQHHWQTDEDQNRAEDSLPALHVIDADSMRTPAGPQIVAPGGLPGPQ